MRFSRWLLPSCFLVLSGLWGCNPYRDRLKGEFNAGSIDPYDFAAPYRSTGTFTREVEGSGTFNDVPAYIGGNLTGYFRFPFAPTQITTTGYAGVAAADPGRPVYGSGTPPNIDPTLFNSLRVAGAGKIPSATTDIPVAYVFDPSPPTTAFRTPTAACVKSDPNYAYDPFRDDVHYDDQGNIFTGLPTATFAEGALPAWTYVPVVREVKVTSNGEICQNHKSEYTVLTSPDVTVEQGLPRADGSPTGQPDSYFLAWALIDPGAPVIKFSDPGTLPLRGFTHQQYGWYNQYLVAYLEGGYIPIFGAIPRMQTQRVFYPRTPVLFSCTRNADCAQFPGMKTSNQGQDACEITSDPPGPGQLGSPGEGYCRTARTCNPSDPPQPLQTTACFAGTTCDMSLPVGRRLCRQPPGGNTGALGAGYDVLDAARGTSGYSPVCQVLTYARTGATRTADLPRIAETITANPGAGGLTPPPTVAAGGNVTPTFIFCLQVP